MRSFLVPLSLWVAGPVSAGEPVLVPDFTPATTSEFSLAFMLQERVMVTLASAGHVVLTSDAVRPVVGDIVDACADMRKCPYEPLQALPARVAVVVRVSRRENSVFAQFWIYDRSYEEAVDSREILLRAGQEQEFAEVVVATINQLFTQIGPANAQDLVAASGLISAAANAAAAVPAPPGSATAPPEAADALDARLAGSDLRARHVLGSEARFLSSGSSGDQWLRAQTPHAGRLLVELRAGVGFGDVDRACDVRVYVDDDVTSSWYQEGPQASQAPRAALFVGYAPLTWMDVGLGFGVQYGQRALTTDILVDGEAAEPQALDGAEVQLDLQPTVRFYVMPVGLVKPFLLVGGDVLLFDKYHIDASGDVAYPQPPGAVVPGVVGGGGLLIDPGPMVGFFAEGSYVRHLGVRSDAAEAGDIGRPDDAPAPPTSHQFTIGVVGGVQIRL
jgi:hypothetical protein